MQQYLDLVNKIFKEGVQKGDRTGTGTLSIFGHQMRFNLQEGFPLVTTKVVHLKSVIVELLWFLQGSTNAALLQENKCRIWDEWALTDADLDKHVVLSLDERIPTVWGDEIEDEDREGRLYVRSAHEDHFFVELDDNEEAQHQYLDDLGISRTKSYRELGFKAGDLGPIYGKQWRSWACPDGSTIDQISEVVQHLKTKPDSRRLIVSAWNPADLPDENISPQDNVLNGKMALAACHTLFQFYSSELSLHERLDYFYQNVAVMVDGKYTLPADFLAREALAIVELDSNHNDRDFSDRNKYYTVCRNMTYTAFYVNRYHEVLDHYGVPRRRLSCQLYQRSADVFLGLPFNISSYALLTMMIAQVANMVPGDFIWTGGDIHVYNNLCEQMQLQLTRDPRPLPKMVINPEVKDIFAFKLEDFVLEGYDPHPAIKGKVAV